MIVSGSATGGGPGNDVLCSVPPVRLLLHPVTLVCLAVLVVNDRWAKGVWGNWVTGKLSDVAGSFLLATLLACGVAALRSLRTRTSAGVTARDAFWCAVVVVAGVAAVKTSAVGADVGAFLLGVFRWPLDAVTALLSSGALPGVDPVAVVVDWTDVFAALAAFAVVALAWRANGSP